MLSLEPVNVPSTKIEMPLSFIFSQTKWIGNVKGMKAERERDGDGKKLIKTFAGRFSYFLCSHTYIHPHSFDDRLEFFDN